MKTILIVIIPMLVTLAGADAQVQSRNWRSHVNGNVYESSITPDELKASSKSETVQISPTVSGSFEPLGECDIKEAIKLADLEANKIIGEDYSGKNPKWILEKAERVSEKLNGVYEAGYYEITYRPVIPKIDSNLQISGVGYLQVIVLLDGKVLPIKSLGKLSEQREHTQIDVRWKGASAEELAEQLKLITADAELTVAEDGKATLYFNSEPADALTKFRAIQDKLPKELIVVRVERVQSAIPEAPEQLKKTQAIGSIKREQAEALGITSEAISNHMQSFGDLLEGESLQKLQESKIKTSDGKEVSLRQLVDVRLMEVQRPLILKK